MPKGKSELVITHRPLAESFRQLRSQLINDSQRLRQWSQVLSVDCESLQVLAGLMLNYAVYSNEKGIVLFSSCSYEHIKNNVASILESPFSSRQLQIFSKLSSELASQNFVDGV